VQTTLPTHDAVIALTFDACGGPRGSGYNRQLIELLRRHSVSATLFINTRWVEANRPVFYDLAEDPLFEIANHGTRHIPLSVTGRHAYNIAGTRDAGEVIDEVAGSQSRLTRLLGHPPKFFRPGTAYYCGRPGYRNSSASVPRLQIREAVCIPADDAAALRRTGYWTAWHTPTWLISSATSNVLGSWCV
jgi:peptidoglycan/xylan/chitin deacetylase (PgdA/CDA1 family)